jgi:hypothetical protein
MLAVHNGRHLVTDRRGYCGLRWTHYTSDNGVMICNHGHFTDWIVVRLFKGKSKVVPVLLTEYPMKAYWGSGCIIQRILDLGTRLR